MTQKVQAVAIAVMDVFDTQCNGMAPDEYREVIDEIVGKMHAYLDCLNDEECTNSEET